MALTGEWTDEDLIAEAVRQGFSLTKRRIVDWTAHGLLGRPKVRGLGRGSDKSVRSDNQAKLLWVLLRMHGEATKLSTLANIPVYIWLGWGGRYVSIDQVRKALRTFSDDGATSSMTKARHTAREYIKVMQVGDVPSAQREKLEDVLIKMSTTTQSTLEPFAKEFSSALYGIVAPDGTPFDLPIVESNLWAVDCRMRAADAFRTGADKQRFSDQLFKTIQTFYQQSAPQYRADNELTEQAVHLELANGACAALLMFLGRELTPYPPPGAPTREPAGR